MFRLRAEGLLALEGVDGVEPDVVHVLVLGGVVHDVLVEAGELVVEGGLLARTVGQLVVAQLHACHYFEVGVLIVPVLNPGDAGGVEGGAEARLFAVLVNPPQIVNAVVHRLVVTVANQ